MVPLLNGAGTDRAVLKGLRSSLSSNCEGRLAGQPVPLDLAISKWKEIEDNNSSIANCLEKL